MRLVAEAQHELWSYFQLKRAVVGGCGTAARPAIQLSGSGSFRLRVRIRGDHLLRLRLGCVAEMLGIFVVPLCS